MKPQEALNLINQIAAQFRGTREDHEKLKQAILVLSELIPKEKEKPKPDARPSTD